MWEMTRFFPYHGSSHEYLCFLTTLTIHRLSLRIDCSARCVIECCFISHPYMCNNCKGVSREAEGHGSPPIFCTSSHFVLWEAMFQTKTLWFTQSQTFLASQFYGLPTSFVLASPLNSCRIGEVPQSVGHVLSVSLLIGPCDWKGWTPTLEGPLIVAFLSVSEIEVSRVSHGRRKGRLGPRGFWN